MPTQLFFCHKPHAPLIASGMSSQADPTTSAPADICPPRPVRVHTGGPERIKPEAPLIDALDGDARRQFQVLDHGFVALVDVMPRLIPAGQTADQAIVQAARVSYGQGTKKISEDQGLIRYLLRHRHTTPFEMVEFKFHIAMPIFIARQWIRHRTANVNEYSGRYSVMPDRFYRPTLEQVRKQSTSNRQGGTQTFIPHNGQADAETQKSPEHLTAQAFVEFLAQSEALYAKYRDLVDRGVSREMARIGLPVSLYTEWYWKIDLHNLLHFLSLRMDPHAQEEIQAYARAMHDLVEPIVPTTMQAWRDYTLGSTRLSRLELEALKAEIAHLRANNTPTPTPLPTDNKREQAEWDAKRTALGL